MENFIKVKGFSRYEADSKSKAQKKEKSKTISNTHKAKYTGAKHTVQPADVNSLKPDAREIMQSDLFSQEKIIKLHELKYSKEEIVTITGRRNDVVSKILRPLLKK